MNINDMFPSKYLKGTDLVDKIVNVTIGGVTFTDEFDEGRKYVLSFRGAKKFLMLNKTNVGILQWLFPDVIDSDGWVGKEIQLYTELVSFKGQTGPAVRIRGIKGPFQPTDVAATLVPAPVPTTPQGPGDKAAAEAKTGLEPMPGDTIDLDEDVMSDSIPF